ncbi:hypothetical protein Bca4012_086841 [Brassica carinata]|uniref:Uncharacterized protein n=1 Tax=Brassica carinata TaxID=52824 RepID=A0A8X7TQ66_BRACI|nr:hypothetical protein Bca52824_089437 [Brassica carinata]
MIRLEKSRRGEMLRNRPKRVLYQIVSRIQDRKFLIKALNSSYRLLQIQYVCTGSDSRSSSVEVIRRAFKGEGLGGKPSKNVAKDLSASGFLVESAIRRCYGYFFIIIIVGET